MIYVCIGPASVMDPIVCIFSDSKYQFVLIWTTALDYQLSFATEYMPGK